MNDERCVSYDESTGACTYPKDFRPVACIDGKCQNNGICDGCNKAHSVVPPKGGELHLLLTPGSQDVTIWKYPV